MSGFNLSGSIEGINPQQFNPDVDEGFKQAVWTALVNRRIVTSKIPPDQMSDLISRLWNNPNMQAYYQQQLAGGPDPNAPTLDFVAKVASAIDQELFVPTQSTDSTLIQTGAQLRQMSGLPMTAAELNQMGDLNTAVPQPFDSRYFNSRYRTETFHQTPGEMGNDYAMPVGTQLYSPVQGTIKTEDGGKRNWGKRVFVVMANGWKFAIGHMSQFSVTDGQQVGPGTLLGLSGGAVGDPSSGQSTGPHVEIQFMDPSGGYIDPLPVLNNIYSGATYSQMPFGLAGAGTVSATDARDRMLGIDPILEARYPHAVSLWKQYFGSQPTAQQLLSVVGGAVTAGSAAGTGGGGGGGQLADLLRQAGFPEQVIPTMVAIGMAESGGRADAVGDKAIGGSIGIWQIYTKAHPNLVSKYNLTDPLQNAKAAKEVFDSQGLNAWSTYKNGAYKQHLGNTGAMVSGGAALDAGQMEDRIRGMGSHIPGLAVGQYTDLRSALNTQSNKIFGHDVTDGMIKEAYDRGMTGKVGVESYLQEMAIEGKIPAAQYTAIQQAAAPHLQGLYNEQGFDPRIAQKVHGQYYPNAAQGPQHLSDIGHPAPPPAPPTAPGKEPDRYD